MKKAFAVALLSAVAVLVAIPGPADAWRDPVPGTVVPTSAAVSASDASSASAPVVLRGAVKAPGRIAVTAGSTRVACARKVGPATVRRTGAAAPYRGRETAFAGPRLDVRGAWRCALRYDGGTSVFADSVSPAVVVRVR